MGLDTVVGRITRDGGPDIDYDIGRSAGHLAGSVETPRWTRRQFHNGTTLTLAMSSGGDLYASYDQGPANFIARRLKSDADLAEVLLMILTYRPIDHFR